MMLARREFVHAVAVSAVFPRGTRAVPGGRIAAVARNIAATDAADVLDARGLIVGPGLVDIHVHTGTDLTPVECLSIGVTSMVDGGSRGADNVAGLVAVAEAAPDRVPFEGLGTRRVGHPADLFVFASEEGEFDFVDNERAVRRGRQKIVPRAVVARGRRVASGGTGCCS